MHRKSKKPDKNIKSKKNKELKGGKTILSTTFLGVRGTIPMSHKNFLKYGGHTSCVQVSNITPIKTVNFLFDAGTGIIDYGLAALRRGERVFHIFLSHMHYDHLIGLTQFQAIFRKDCEIHFYGQAKGSLSLKKIITNFFSAPFFPVEFQKLPSLHNLHFHEIGTVKSINVEDVRIDIQPLNHPQEAIAFKVWNIEQTKSMVYATDHEHGCASADQDLKKFITNTDLLIFDSTYSDLEYNDHQGWGHSTAKFGAQLAKECQVKKYFIFHHEPHHTDKYLEHIHLPEAKKIYTYSYLARENTTIVIK